jgi:hypothetical protein
MLFLLFVFASGSIAQAAGFSVSAGVFYFTNDDRKIASLETETTEGGTTFRYERDKKVVAGELAREEMRQGNVCLQQLALDLEQELRKPGIRNLCSVLFKDEISDSEMDEGVLVCSAQVEARQEAGSIQLSAVFNLAPPAKDIRQNRMISSVGRQDFKIRPEISSQTAVIGKPAGTWKGLLKNGSCSFNEKIVQSLYDNYLAILNGSEKLNRCNQSQQKRMEQLSQLQNEFKEYVPDEWLRSFETEKVELLLRQGAGKDLYSSLSECRKASRMTGDRLQRLEKIAGTIAEQHKVPALHPANRLSTRGLSSETDEL